MPAPLLERGQLWSRSTGLTAGAKHQELVLTEVSWYLKCTGEEPEGWVYSPDPTEHRRAGSEASTLVCLRACKIPRLAGIPQSYPVKKLRSWQPRVKVLMFYKYNINSE